MYVPKVPRRSDFCGCPPCGLCYDWVEPVPPEEVKKADGDALALGYRIDGVRKMTEDILGKDVVPTPAQKKQIYEGAVFVHERNKLNAQKDPLELNQDVIDESFTRQSVESFLVQKRKEASVVRKPVNTITCDSIADEKAEKEKEKKKDKVKEKEKAPVYENPYARDEAPVDYDLLQRESQNSIAGRSAAREAMLKRYRDNLDREKAKWKSLDRDLDPPTPPWRRY